MPKRWKANFFNDYELLDAGDGKKLERFGEYVLIRPESKAYFKPILPFDKWLLQADAEFLEENGKKGFWKFKQKSIPEKGWQIDYNGVKIILKTSVFKHIGVFPEQEVNWHKLESMLQPGQKVLNLFSYTGMTSLIAAKKGANTFHVDASSSVVQWASENAKLNNTEGIHWVVEDALTFLKKEVKRGRKYDWITMDPPAFGIGPKNKRWKIEKLLPELLQNASKALQPSGFLILNTYSPKINEKVLEELILEYFPNKNYQIKTLSMVSKTGKILDTGLLTHIYQ